MPEQDAPDTDKSSTITDHHFVPHETEPWRTCQYPGCALAEAAHAKGPIEDTDPGRPPSMRHFDSYPPPLETMAQGLAERARQERENTLQKEGHKDDDGKTPFFYLPWEALEEVAFVMQYGAKKYAPGNYRKGMKSSRLFSACVRHLKEWWLGKKQDEETGKSPLAHAVCCLLMLRENEMNRTATDDRYADRTYPTNPGSA